MSIKLRQIGDQHAFLCPGCGVDHRFDSRWNFNGDYERPTITPGLKTGALLNFQDGRAPIPVRCWADITDGRITFRDWSSHALRGQTVDLPDIPNPEPAVSGTIGG